MSSFNRSVRTFFGAAAVLLLITLNPVFADEKDNAPKKGDSVSGANLDLYDIQFGLWTSAYGSKVTHRGGETNSRYGNSSNLIYGRGTLTSGDIILQAGLYGRGEFDRFEGLDGGEYSGDSNLFGGGLDTVIAFRNSDYWYNPPFAVFSGRVGVLYRGHDGELKDGSYEAESEDWFLDFRAELQIPWVLEFAGACHAWRVQDGDDVIIARKGAISNIVGSFSGRYSLDSNRRTTVTRAGGEDDQDQTEFEWSIRLELFKLASDTTDLSKSALVEFGFAVSYGQQYLNAFGTNTREEGHRYHIDKLAVHGQLIVNRFFYVEGTAGVWWNPDSESPNDPAGFEHDQSGAFISLSIGFNFGFATKSASEDRKNSCAPEGYDPFGGYVPSRE